MSTVLFEPPPPGAAWTERNCLCCGKRFWVRDTYVRRGNGKFCTTSCGVSYRNQQANPAKRPEVRVKISANHADVSGKNNPMYGSRGFAAPGFIDGRRTRINGPKVRGDTWRVIAFARKRRTCEICGVTVKGLHVHHIDGNRENNALNNLQILCVTCHHNEMHPRERDSLGRFRPVKGVV